MRLSAIPSFHVPSLRTVTPAAEMQTAPDVFQLKKPRFGMAVALPEVQKFSLAHRSVVDAALLIASQYGANLPQSTIFRKQMSLMIYDERMQQKIAERAFRNIPEATVFRLRSRREGFELTIGYMPPPPDGPVVILSPDAGGRIDDMRPLILALRKRGIGVMAFQYAITGKNGKTVYEQVRAKDAYSPERLLAGDANDVSEWLNNPNMSKIKILSGAGNHIHAVDYSRHALVGSSSGGQVGLQVAAAHRERGYKVVTMGSPDSMGAFADTWTRTESHPRLWRMLSDARKSRVQEAIGELEKWFNLDVLSRVWQPVLVLAGTEDHAAPKALEHIRGLNQENIQIVPIEGANHNNMLNDYCPEPTRGRKLARDVDNLPQRHPEAVADEIARFIGQS